MKSFLFDFSAKKQANQKDLESVVGAIKKADTKEKLENLLLGLFTAKELEEFAQRLEIVKMLKQKVGQHEIAAQLGVGVATVSRGAQELKQGRFKYV